MKRLAGQAGRTLAAIGMAVMTLFLVLVLGAGALAYRLSQGPLDIPWAATRLANAVSGADVQVHIGQAALTWTGYKHGSGAPLFLRLGDITLRESAGATLATIPEAQLIFSAGALFADHAPIFVRSQNAQVMDSDAPVSLLANIRLGVGFSLRSAMLQVTLGPGRVGPPGLDENLEAGWLQFALTPNDLRLEEGRLILQPFGHSAPVIGITAAAHRDGDWHGAITLTAQQVRAEDLQHYWPRGLASATRAWVTGNITAGTARDASFTLGLAAASHLAGLRLENARGAFKADGLVLTWLPGVLPITGLAGKFTLTDVDDIDITANSARLGGIVIAAAHMHIAGVSRQNQTASLEVPVTGAIPDAIAVLNGPNLRLLQDAPPPLRAATGSFTGNVKVTLPLVKRLAMDQVRMQVTTVLSDVTLKLPQGFTLRQGRLNVAASLQQLEVSGQATLSGQPASLNAKVNFGNGAAVTLDAKTIVNAAALRNFGWDPGDAVQGEIPLRLHIATRADRGSVEVNADLTPAKLAFALFGWRKAAGQPGALSLAASLDPENFSGIERIERISASAPQLDVQSSLAGETIELTHVRIGDTEGAGRISPPAGSGSPWVIALTGNALDLASVVNPPRNGSAVKKPAPGPMATQPNAGPLWRASLRFGRVILARAPEPALQNFSFEGSGKGRFIYAANAEAGLGAGAPVRLVIAPAASAPGADETLEVQTADGGALLRALGVFDELRGGDFDLSARYGVTLPIQGVTRIGNFRLLKAPALAKFLQAVTVLGIPEAASGPGLQFTRLIVPFTWQDQRMTLRQAQAYSASLGFTASGTIDLDTNIYDIHGTVVPAYALNALPGKIPLIGKLFSPEKGGGLFAMRYSITGPTADPKVSINPLSALTPGFLRGIFGPQGKRPAP